MKIWVSVETREIPKNEDPLLDLIPILEGEGFMLVANGVEGGHRFLGFERVGSREQQRAQGVQVPPSPSESENADLRRALQAITPESPLDVDQDCHFCGGHYHEHDEDCAWRFAREALGLPVVL